MTDSTNHPLRSRRTTAVPALATLAIAMGCASPAWAIDGGSVVAGTGTIQTQRNITTVNQSSDRMVVNWKNFDIARNQSVEFRQPGANSAVLNRVASTRQTEILGALKGNGQVFVINPQGVMFGRTAKVDVGSLVASTLDTTNEQFINLDRNVSNSTGGGYMHFAGNAAGSVENQGRINASDRALLIAPQVTNRGQIQARQVELHAADGVAMNGHLTVMPTTPSAKALALNEGTIRAPGGNVVMSAAAIGNQIRDVVRNTGTIEATYAASYEGGGIKLMAPVDGAIDMGGRVNASRLVEGTTLPSPEFDAPLSGYERASTGHDVRVAKGGQIAGEGVKQLSAHDGNLDVLGRVNGAIVDLRGEKVTLNAPINAKYDVNVRARGDVNQTSNVTTELGHIDMEGSNIYQGERTTTRAGNYISLSTPDQGGVYARDGVAVVVPPNLYRTGQVRAGNLEADSVAVVSNRIELNGRIKARGDVQIIAKDFKYVCLAGPGESCISLAGIPGQVNQRGDIVSTDGSIYYDANRIDQQVGTRTQASDDVVMNARNVTAANISAGNRVAINATSGATLTGRVTAPKVELPANVRYEGGTVRKK